MDESSVGDIEIGCDVGKVRELVENVIEELILLI